MAFGEVHILERLADHWWAIGLRGLFAVIFGLVAFVLPLPTLVALVWLFGAFAFVDGVFSLVAAWRRHAGDPPWWALLLTGLAGVAAGIISFIWPGITALALVILVAAWALITGALEIASAVRLRKEIEDEWLLGLSGVLTMGLGALLVVAPDAGAIGLVWFFGAYAVLFGVMMMALAYRLRAYRDRMRSADRRLAA